MKHLLLMCLLSSGMTLYAEKPLPSALDLIREFITQQEESGRIDRSRPDWKTRLPKFPEVTFRENARYLWELKTTEGEMTFVLDHVNAPEHVRNILYLSELGYYEGILFHRIIPGFMAQGGCPLGQGHGNPGYFLKLEAKRSVKHEGAGILSMARSAHPDSAGSQFFITFVSRPGLDGGYTVFGSMLDGKDTLKKLEDAGDPRNNGMNPKKEIRITGTRVYLDTEGSEPNEH
jgi:cyclophilin family peptidyl-prolyl cis-trans isomerase